MGEDEGRKTEPEQLYKEKHTAVGATPTRHDGFIERRIWSYGMD